MKNKIALFASIILVIVLSSWKFENNSNSEREILKGKWYSVGQNKFENIKATNSKTDWYSFNGRGNVIYSSCTDLNADVRTELFGKYQWENDSIIIVNYTRVRYKSKGVPHPANGLEIRYWVNRIGRTTLLISPIE